MVPLSSLEKVVLALILSVVLFFCFFRITESPPFTFDEGNAVQISANIAEHGISGLQFSPGHRERLSIVTSVGYTLLHVLAFWFKLFGVGILQARIMMVVYMLAFMFLSFMLLRRLYGNTIALSSLAILSTFPPLYSFGKSVFGEVPLLFFLVLFFLFFNLAAKNPERRKFWYILCGVAAGLCIVTKTMALAFIPVLFITAFIAWKRRLASWQDIGIVALSAIAPVIVWVIVNFQIGDSLASVLDYYSNPSALTDKTATFWRNLHLFFSGIGPLFLLACMSVWIVGVAVRLGSKTKILVEECTALVFSLVLMLSLLFRYWDARYYFPIQVLGILFAPYSFQCILLALPLKINPAKKIKFFSFGIVTLSLLGLYQLSFRSYMADSYKSTVAKDMTEYFASVPDSTSVFFYNAPHVVPFFHGSNYYQKEVMFEKWVVGSDYASIINSGRIDVLVLSSSMSKADEKVSLSDFELAVAYGQISIFKRKIK